MAQYSQLPSHSTAALPLYSDADPSSSRPTPASTSQLSRPLGISSAEKPLLGDKTSDEEEDEQSELEREIEHTSPPGSRSWTDKLPLRPRTILLSTFSLSILISLLLFFHPSASPLSHLSWSSISHDASSYYSGAPLSIGLYDPSLGQLAKNPLEQDATFADVPFAAVGNSWDEKGRKPEWAGGDGGSGDLEKGFKVGKGDATRYWNGTNWFDRTVILVTIEGMRPDYLTPELTPNLLELADKGFRAQSLQPVFPALSAPNHWSILTGLYPSSHGIVANRFSSSSLSKTFDVETESCVSAWDPDWYHGEPIYQTALRSNLKVATLMHPLVPPLLHSTAPSKPTYWYPPVPHTHPRKKLSKLFQFLDLSYQKRPQLILMNFEEVANEARKSGGELGDKGNGKGVEKTLSSIDEAFFGALREGMRERNLEGQVEIVVVGDTGLKDVEKDKVVVIDELLDSEVFASLEQPLEGGSSTVIGLRLETVADGFEAAVAKLRAVSKDGHGGFRVYTKADAPNHWHISFENDRTAPVWLVAEEGWTLTTRTAFDANGDKLGFKAANGYDPASSTSMDSIFLASGPYSSKLGHKAFESFSNLEVYDFVATSLNISIDMRAQNNGTQGFWEDVRSD